MDIREDRAWLLQSRINPFPVAGALSLADGRISFTLDETAEEAALGWLEEELGASGLKSLLVAGEQVTAFDYALDDCAVTWPITGGGAMMIVRAPGSRKWVVAYDYPSGGTISQTFPVMSGRKKAREWKRVLAEHEAASA